MKVAVIGGGNIGTALVCYIKKQHPEYIVSLLTRKPERFSKEILCNDIEGSFSYSVKIDQISEKPSLVIKDAEIIYISMPHFAIEETFSKIAPYVKEGAFIGVIPGGGGCEFFFDKYFKGKAVLFGFQRVPFTAKLVTYGWEVNLKSWKPYSVVGTLKKKYLGEVCQKVEACGLKTKKADNYLAVALTPTNPILHTSRTYELFSKYKQESVFGERLKYYVGWTDYASEIMLSMDGELHKLLEAIPELDTSAIRPLTEHYEAETVEKMTKKINSIETFKSVYAPLKPVDDNPDMGFVADTSSRLFTEDFPWGLAIFRAYCEIVGIKAPTMDKVLSWYAGYMGYEWYVNGRFCGKDLNITGIPQNYGIRTKQELLSIYAE